MGRSTRMRGLAAALLMACTAAAHAAPPALEDFFSGTQIRAVSISPDGKLLAMIVAAEGKTFVAVKDRTSATPAAPVLAASGKDSFEPSWCRWGNNERLVCSFRGLERDKYLNKVFPVTRLVAVNADGSNQKKLLQDPFNPSGQLNDRIIDWTPDKPRSVLIEKYSRGSGVRVLELDIYNGEVDLYEPPHEYAYGFGTDGQGNVRLAWGQVDLKNYYYARLTGEKKWRRLARVKALTSDEAYYPLAVVPGTNYAWALRDHEGRSALWKIDLADKEDPLLVFASSRVDVRPVLAPDGRVLAVVPDSGSKDAYIVDPAAEVPGQVLRRLFTDREYHLADMTGDLKTVVVMAESDVRVPEYFVLDMTTPQAKLQRVGSRFPGLEKAELARTERITYPASDGTPIPAYLSKPVGTRDGAPPLIVLPHGGPWARDQWGFDSWVQMLVRDGYAVLQMNYRGSGGYGKKWREASLGDWSGLPYSDTIDGLKWALAQKHGDPQRVCVVGGSFGGYLALAAATRDSNLLKCVVSVAGVSDLRELRSDSEFFANYRVMRELIGKDPEKLKADSPRLHAGTIAVPVLLIHGTEDYTVEPDQSQFMAKALAEKNRNHKLVLIPDTDHHFISHASQRQLFGEISAFLKTQFSQ